MDLKNSIIGGVRFAVYSFPAAVVWNIIQADVPPVRKIAPIFGLICLFVAIFALDIYLMRAGVYSGK
jgi:hypothetical protein